MNMTAKTFWNIIDAGADEIILEIVGFASAGFSHGNNHWLIRNAVKIYEQMKWFAENIALYITKSIIFSLTGQFNSAFLDVIQF